MKYYNTTTATKLARIDRPAIAKMCVDGLLKRDKSIICNGGPELLIKEDDLINALVKYHFNKVIIRYRKREENSDLRWKALEMFDKRLIDSDYQDKAKITRLLNISGSALDRIPDKYKHIIGVTELYNIHEVKEWLERRKNPALIKQENTMINNKPEICPIEEISPSTQVLEDFMNAFLSLDNSAKANYIHKILPVFEIPELVKVFNESYPPKLKFSDVKASETLFHPLIGYIVIERVDEKWLYFFGNGQEWKADHDGHIDGAKNKRPVLFFSLDDYTDYMKNSVKDGAK